MILSWCYFGSDAKKPTIDFLRSWNRIAHLMGARDNNETEVNQSWANLLNTYNIMEVDELDETILKVIEKGFIEETGFIEAAEEWHHKFVAHDLDQSFSDAWKLYHNTFANNETELANALITSLKKSVTQVNTMNLSGTTMLLRFLEREDDANELIEYYVNSWIAEKRSLELKKFPFASDIKDPMIWEIFEARAKKIEYVIPLPDITYSIINNSITNAERKSLRAATVNDFYNLFNQEHGDNLSRLITGSLEFLQYPPEDRVIGENAHAALVRIGKESRLNTRRLTSYNIHADS